MDPAQDVGDLVLFAEAGEQQQVLAGGQAEAAHQAPSGASRAWAAAAARVGRSAAMFEEGAAGLRPFAVADTERRK